MPGRRADRARPLAAAADQPDRRGDRGRLRRRRRGRRRADADPGFLEIGQGAWEGLHRTEIDARYARRAGRLAPPAARGVGARRRVAPRGPGTGPAGPGRVLARLAEGGSPGTLDRPQVAGYRDATLDHPWSIVVGHDGVFKVALLTLFDLPLDRFWMWSMDLCGISVIEFRGGRPVLRAHNLTAHLADLLDEDAQTELDERSRSGAL